MADEAGMHFHAARGARTADWPDRALAALVWSAAAGVTAVFLWLLGDIVVQGLDGISWAFLTEPVADAGRGGGIAPVIVSSLLILAVCLAAAVPLGVATAVWLAELTRRADRLSAVVRRSLDVLAGVPSIVFGLFGNAFFCVYLGMGYSIAAGGLTLACMVLPLFIRAAEEGFRAVPDSYRAAAAATGVSRLGLLRHVLLPAAAPGLIVGLVLSVGRALAETAALLFTSGYVTRMPDSLADSGRALPIHIYDLSMHVAGGTANAYSSALVLIVLLLTINGLAAIVGRRFLARNLMTT